MRASGSKPLKGNHELVFLKVQKNRSSSLARQVELIVGYSGLHYRDSRLGEGNSETPMVPRGHYLVPGAHQS